jgi:predicted aldo/keto reductase-like oxidoreductase
VAKAVERGINYFDVAPSYGDAEIKLGPALEPYRKDVFLACKTAQRERKAAEAEFARSLKLLRTDHFDLYQLHAITDVEKDVDSVFMKEGVMDMIDREKRDGRIRYVGFSAHSEEAALAALDRYDFDSILFPVSFATYLEGNFGPRVMEVCRKKKVAVLALKGMAKQHWQGDAMLRQMYPKCWYEPLHEPDWSELGLRWTLSQPVVSAVPPGEEPLFWKAVEIAERFKPIREQETARLKEYAATLKPLFRGHA